MGTTLAAKAVGLGVAWHYPGHGPTAFPRLRSCLPCVVCLRRFCSCRALTRGRCTWAVYFEGWLKSHLSPTEWRRSRWFRREDLMFLVADAEVEDTKRIPDVRRSSQGCPDVEVLVALLENHQRLWVVELLEGGFFSPCMCAA